MLNYTIQPFGGQFFEAILPVELCGRQFQRFFFSQIFLSDNLSHFYFAFDPP
jgi:hypothetical protein